MCLDWSSQNKSINKFYNRSRGPIDIHHLRTPHHNDVFFLLETAQDGQQTVQSKCNMSPPFCFENSFALFSGNVVLDTFEASQAFWSRVHCNQPRHRAVLVEEHLVSCFGLRARLNGPLVRVGHSQAYAWPGCRGIEDPGNVFRGKWQANLRQEPAAQTGNVDSLKEPSALSTSGAK